MRSSVAFTVRRCQILLASADGLHTTAIAHHLHCTDQTVHNALYDFHQRGLAALQPRSSRPQHTNPVFSLASRAQLRAILHQSPRAFGKHTSIWTLALAAEVAFAQGITPRLVSDETIRTALTQLKISWKRAKHWITSPEVARPTRSAVAIASAA